MSGISPRLHTSIDGNKKDALRLISDVRAQLEKLEDDLTHDRWRPVSDDRDRLGQLASKLDRALTRWIALDAERADFGR